jgi:D-amino-acid dehydrogenase
MSSEIQTETSKPDVIIIGAGVIGMCAAYYLRKSGRSVLIIDQAEPGSGASFGNCGMISPSHVLPNTLPGLPWKAFKWMFQKSAPFKVVPQFNLEFISWMYGFWRRCSMAQVKATAPALASILASSRTLFHELISQEKLQVDYDQSGCIYVYSTPAAFEQEAQWGSIYRECGVEVRALDAKALATLEPALKQDAIYGGYHFPNDANLRPDYYVVELARRLREMGVQFSTGNAVAHIEDTQTGVRVHTAQGKLDAGRAILAAGSWSPLLSKRLGFRLPIQPGKGYSIAMGRPNRCPIHCMVLKEKSVAVTPWASGYRLGSTMEFVGYDESLNPNRLQALIDGAGAFLHEPTGPGERLPWFGWRPMSVDTVPIIDKAPNFKNLWLATGHSMLGVSMSTGTGKLIAELLSDEKPHINPEPYRYGRF